MNALVFLLTKHIIIRCVFFFLSIGRESTTWPANNCLRIMVRSCVVPSKRVWLQIIFCSCVIGTTFSREKWQIASLSCQEVIKIWKQTWWSNNKTIIELGYGKISWFVSGEQINYLPKPKAEANNIIDLRDTDKSRYFAQPCPIIVNYCHVQSCSIMFILTVCWVTLWYVPLLPVLTRFCCTHYWKHFKSSVQWYQVYSSLWWKNLY